MWPFGRRGAVEYRDISIGDPALAELFGLAYTGDAGMSVTYLTAMGLTAVYRAVSFISGTVAGLPLHSFVNADAGRERIETVFDDPGNLNDLTRFEWVEDVMTGLLLHGNAFEQPRVNDAGDLLGLTPVHPVAVNIKVDKGLKTFEVTQANKSKKVLGPDQLVHIPALKLDGVRGLSPIQAARQSFGTALAGDKAAARMFGSGLLISGMVTADGEDVPKEEMETILNGFREKAAGTKRAGDIIGVNRNLKFTPWSMTAKDAEFMAARQFGVVEVARAYGLPPILLSDSTNTTSWGQGVQEVIRGVAKFTLRHWTERLQQRFTKLLPKEQFVEFDFAGLLQGNQAEVTANLIAEIDAGLLTVNEARRILNRPALPEGGDDGQV